MTSMTSLSVDDDVEGGHDVRVLQAHGQTRLVEEHRDELRIRRKMRVHSLEGNRASESGLRSHPPR